MILIRHGETNENAAGRYLGHYDAPLNKLGQQQIQSLATNLIKTLGKESISALYSSDLLRAKESAQIIGEALQMKPSADPALRELSFGKWECKTYDEIMSEAPRLVTKWINDPFKLAPPEGETLNELGSRVHDWFKQVLCQHTLNDTVLIVSHQGPIRWLLSHYYLGNSTKFWDVEGINHGSGVLLEFDLQLEKIKSVQNIG
ncbi:histidine phosphatase family protein [Bacillus sp. AFS040349]|uniref:histidine phosphatase family protein n=1 Tax=Bacillus sp. AFS040349 TaxID=2033502 RepID=UPI002100061E|nr:histidine phosphatase family protein [Bacillus sp. AFS040349]